MLMTAIENAPIRAFASTIIASQMYRTLIPALAAPVANIPAHPILNQGSRGSGTHQETGAF